MRLFYAGVSNNSEFGYVPDTIEIISKDNATTKYFLGDGGGDYESGLYGYQCCDFIDSEGKIVEDSMRIFLQIITAKKVTIYFYPVMVDTWCPDIFEKAKYDYFDFCHGRLFDDEDNSVNFEFEAKLKFDF